METDKPHELELVGHKIRSPKTVQVQMLLFVGFYADFLFMEKKSKTKTFHNYQCLIPIKGYTGRSMIKPKQVDDDVFPFIQLLMSYL